MKGGEEDRRAALVGQSNRAWDVQYAVRVRREAMRRDTREQAESILKLAGFTFEHVWELVNGYWPDSPDYDEVRRPWWLFLTQIGPVRLGWRKRVLEIDWSATSVRGIVTEDSVTKEEALVHAWNVAKAVEYMQALLRLSPSIEEKGCGVDGHGIDCDCWMAPR